MMTKRPWMPFDIPAYMGDTTGFSVDQHGAYVLILCAMWMEGGFLPDDESVLANIAKMGLKRWRKIRDPIMRKLIHTPDGVTQNRLLKELRRADLVSQKRKHSGALGGIATALKYNDAAVANATANGPPKRQQTGRQNGAERPRQSQLQENISTSETVSARAESSIDRASSSGLEGPPTRSDEPPSLIALADERRDRLAESLRRMGREPTTTKRIAEAR